MKAPKWRTWAFLVYGGDRHGGVHLRSVVARHLKAWPEGRPDQLTVKELNIIEAQCTMQKGLPLCGVHSVVKVGVKAQGNDLKRLPWPSRH